MSDVLATDAFARARPEARGRKWIQIDSPEQREATDLGRMSCWQAPGPARVEFVAQQSGVLFVRLLTSSQVRPDQRELIAQQSYIAIAAAD